MKVDMSARGVMARLKRVSQLRRLCLLLGKAKAVDFEKRNLVRHAKNAESESSQTSMPIDLLQRAQLYKSVLQEPEKPLSFPHCMLP